MYRLGMVTLLFSFIPPIRLLFSFTNTVGTTLWAAQLEAQVNIIENQAVPQGKKKAL